MKTQMDNVEKEFQGTAALGFHGLRMKTDNSNEGVHLNEWCLNGPRKNIFSRATERKVLRTFARERLESKDNKFDSVKVTRESSNYGVDFIRIKTDDLQFIIEEVPHGVGPNWSANMGIE